MFKLSQKGTLHHYFNFIYLIEKFLYGTLSSSLNRQLSSLGHKMLSSARSFSLYSIEVEYRVMTSTIKKVVWLHWLLANMGVFISHHTPVYYGKIKSVHNLIFYEQIKHIEIHYYLARHHFKHGPVDSLRQVLSLSFTSSCIISQTKLRSAMDG